MHQPPVRCPNTSCHHHQAPQAGFYTKNGQYYPACRIIPVPRFRCRACRKSFSTQTFRTDYRDKLPDHNRLVLDLLVGGMSFRRTGRTLGIHNSTVQRKAEKMARSLEHLHQNLMFELPDRKTYLLDEEESYEQKSIRTVTLPILIEGNSWFVVATDVEPIRRLAPKGTLRRRRQDSEEARLGKRPDRSREAVTAVLATLAKATVGKRVALITDRKSPYATIARRLFSERLTSHVRVPSRLPRNQFNPLFPINTTNAMTRDLMARLRRRTWCVSKKRERLKSHLILFTAYRNYVRPRFNSDEVHQTPAERLGLLPRNLSFEELLRWRQDWGPLSSHPMSVSGARTVRKMATSVCI